MDKSFQITHQYNLFNNLGGYRKLGKKFIKKKKTQSEEIPNKWPITGTLNLFGKKII